MKLTQQALETLKCPPGKQSIRVFDTDLKGFGVRVSSGARTFFVQYGSKGSKQRVTIGRFGVLTVAEARREARVLLGSVARGDDPVADRKAATAAAQAAKLEAAFTFGAMVEAWAEARSTDRRPSYLKEAVASAHRNLPEWRDRAAATITFAEAVAALDAVKSTRGIYAANRTLAHARGAFAWAMRRQLVPANPLHGLERPGREETRERVLNGDELAAIWRACDTIGPTQAAFVKVLMLTLQRLQEVGAMGWSELDNPDDPTVWTLPGERVKNRKTHVVHLSEPARKTVRAMPRIHGNPHVFAGLNGKSIVAFNYIKIQLQRAVCLPDWRFHDLRRSGVTTLAGLGVPPHIADKLLNHVGGTISGVAAVYQRHEFLTERKAALDAWASYVLGRVHAT